MSFELPTYGLVAGIMYQKLAGKKYDLYCSLIGAMVAGRIDDFMQNENISKREGEEKLERYINEWNPKENAYLDKFVERKKCIIVNWD